MHKFLAIFRTCVILASFFLSPGHSLFSVFAQDIPNDWPEPTPNLPHRSSIEEITPYYSIEHLTITDGTPISGHIINGPPNPPDEFVAERAASILPITDATILTEFPSYDWVFGCSAVSSAMIAGFYDRNAYTNMYSGPTNGGVMPVTDTSWPTWFDGYDPDPYPNNPLIASHIGVDGRTTRGSIDDYWVRYGSYASDPYITNSWPQHTWGTAIGDYMKTSQSNTSNPDGSTTFYTYTSSSDKLTCSTMQNEGVANKDGTYGRKLFYEARGYSVTDCFNQPTDNYIVGGFSLVNFQAEINAGHPVLLNLEGHSIVGYGYNGTTIYVRDTWDSDPSHIYSMTWGGSYQSMRLVSVSVVHLEPPTAIEYHVFLPSVITGVVSNLAPTNLIISNSSIQEIQPVNTVVGTLSTVDPDASDTFSYSLVSGAGDTDNASFNISGDQLRSSQVFDYETKNSYSVRIRSTDQGGLSFEKAFLITITDAVEGGIINGDFEAGATGWAEYSSHGWDIIMLSSEIDGLYAHSGNWLAYLAGGDSETSSISQSITIPSGMSYLHYWYWIESEDSCGYDYFRVKIGATTVRTQNLCYSSSTGGWVHGSIDLSLYANVPLTLKFEAITDISNISLIFLDDIYLASTATNSPERFIPGRLDVDFAWKEDW